MDALGVTTALNCKRGVVKVNVNMEIRKGGASLYSKSENLIQSLYGFVLSVVNILAVVWGTKYPSFT